MWGLDHLPPIFILRLVILNMLEKHKYITIFLYIHVSNKISIRYDEKHFYFCKKNHLGNLKLNIDQNATNLQQSLLTFDLFLNSFRWI